MWSLRLQKTGEDGREREIRVGVGKLGVANGYLLGTFE